MFLWHIVYGHPNKVIKSETLKEIENYVVDEKETGEDGGLVRDGSNAVVGEKEKEHLVPIPIKIRKADEEDSLESTLDASTNGAGMSFGFLF